jgi:RNA polymerase sigma factor (TIGR02999 family)
VNPVTALLDRLRAGDPRAAAELFDRVYSELKRMAAAQVRAEAGHSYSPTELVHEAYLRLFPGPAPNFADWAYFFAAAATAMRRVRVDHARARGAAKRGGGQGRVDLDSGTAAVPEPDLDLVALDEALGRLERLDARKAQVVKLRFFAGLTGEQAARTLGIATSTADADWAFARCWLRLEMGDPA